jgi:eukaryotic-like serine/threonine-protein kinase
MDADRWHEIERLFHAALELKSGERAAFLETACDGDDSLRTEVESLLESSERAGSFMESPAADAVPDLLDQGSSLQEPTAGVEPGATVAHYRILQKLGAGGMGEVYRARDTRLGRDVAIKILPPDLAAKLHARQRFEREARALASLQHPHICTLHDVGHEGGTDFLVMELLEGQTLAKRLAKGRLATAEVLKLGIEICEGLEAAHRAGVVHRDLKPANIMLTKAGVKLLDFGLAKPMPPLTPSPSPSGESRRGTRPGEGAADARTASSATEAAIPEPVTVKGTIMGTLQYASPEQLQGQEADERSDIFSLGAVLYEMASGKRAFEGKTQASVIAAVLGREPVPISQLQPVSPLALDRVVETCLAKDPEERFTSAHDVKLQLAWIRDAAVPGSAGILPATPGAARRRARPWIVAAIVLAAVAAAGWWLASRRASTRALPDFQQLTFDQGSIFAARFTPGGRSIYYSAAWGGQSVQLYATQPSAPGSRPLALENSTLFAVSPSELAVSLGCKLIWYGLCAGTLAVVPISGGAPREIADNVVSADWGPNGELAAIREVGGKFQVEFPLGKVIYRSPDWLGFLRISPRGDEVAFVDYSVLYTDVGQVVILAPGGRQIARSKTFISVEGLAWSPRGNEVWFGSSLPPHAMSDTIRALSLSGRVRVILRVPEILRLSDVSRDGDVLVSQEALGHALSFRSASGAKERDLSWLGDSLLSDLSPDGRNIAFFEWGIAATSSTVYMRGTDGSPAIKLGEGEVSVFSPDGEWVLTVEPGSPDRLTLLPAGVGGPRPLNTPGIAQLATPGWMPDGKEIYFVGYDGHEWRMYTQNLSGGPPRALTPPISLHRFRWEAHLASRDGKWVFARDTEGKGWLYPVAGGQPQPVPGLLPGNIWAN